MHFKSEIIESSYNIYKWTWENPIIDISIDIG